MGLSDVLEGDYRSLECKVSTNRLLPWNHYFFFLTIPRQQENIRAVQLFLAASGFTHRFFLPPSFICQPNKRGSIEPKTDLKSNFAMM